MSFGALTPPVRRGGRDNMRSASSMAMDMESIRARRARLEDIISTMRLPPLTKDATKIQSASSLFPSPSTFNRGYISGSWSTLRRHSSDNISMRAPRHSNSIPGGGITPEPMLRLAPMTPYHYPLPDIGKSRDFGSLLSSPAVSRQVSGKRRTPTPSIQRSSIINEEESRPLTGKSRIDPETEDVGNVELDDRPETLAEIVRGLSNSDEKKRLSCTIKARKLLSREENPPIKGFLKAGILIPLIPLMQQEGNSEQQFEATWTLTNLASGTSEQTASVVDAGTVPVLVGLLNSPSSSSQLKEQSAWALGNISGECPQYRNLVVQAGILDPLLRPIIESGKEGNSSGEAKPKEAPYFRVAAWVLTNLFRHKGLDMSWDQKEDSIKALKILLSYKDKEIIVDSLWAICYLCDLSEESAAEVVEEGMVPLLVKHMDSGERQHIIPALRATGSILSGNDEQTDVVLEAGVLPIYRKLLSNGRRPVVKEAAWAVSNITAGSRSQIQQVIDAELIPALVEAIKGGHMDVQKEATWALSNLTCGGTQSQVEALVDADAVPVLIEMLSLSDTSVVVVSLEAIQNILKILDDNDVVLETIRQERGVEKLKVLQLYVDVSVGEKATEILDAFFPDEAIDSDNETK